MTIRPFLMWPDKRLRQAVARINGVTDDVHTIWADMIDTMYAMPGVGLAAPQIGVMQALAVVDCSEGRNQPVQMANPELVWASDQLQEHTEGSPNLPNQWAKVTRPSKVRVRYVDETGASVEKEFDGLWATSVQHQIDHLGGQMFFDRLGGVKRRLMLNKHQKAMRKRGLG